jgi:hypothetical protein
MKLTGTLCKKIQEPISVNQRYLKEIIMFPADNADIR